MSAADPMALVSTPAGGMRLRDYLPTRSTLNSRQPLGADFGVL